MKKTFLWYRKIYSICHCKNCLSRLLPKAIFLMVFLFLMLSWSGGFSQDNIYGDYLLGSLDKKVSLELENAQLVDVLKMLSQQVNLNFISTEAVGERMLTLYMEKVPLRDAMDVIFVANNLAYDYYPDSNIFVVKEMGKPSLELKTKIYQLRYARVSSSKMETEVVSMLSCDGEGEETETEDVGIKGAVESVLTEFGKVTEDPITNSLVVVDVPVQFPMIDEVISRLDSPPVKIMIEVEMMDVAKSHLDNIGFDFTNGLYGTFTTGSRSTTFPWWGEYNGQGAGGDAFSLSTLDFSSFTTIMKFLSEDITTKFLARPKILTLANETAEVNLVLNEVIGLTTTTDGEGNTTQEIERDDTGTRLRVTPQVNLANNEITLVVDVFNKESANSTIQVSGMDAGFVKNVEERSTKSIVRLKSGETLFIGGLLKKEEDETVTKIPLLGDLPLIGRFFRYVDRPSADNVNRELLVFVTPRILKDGETLIEKAKVLSREQQNFSKESSIKVALDRYK